MQKTSMKSQRGSSVGGKWDWRMKGEGCGRGGSKVSQLLTNSCNVW